MDGRVHGRGGYPWAAPTICDYGTLLELSADGGVMMHVGVTSLAAITNPLNPNGGGGTNTRGTTGSGGELPGSTGVAGTGNGGGGGTEPSGIAGGGAGGGGGGDTGGGKLPFTGFPAAVLAGAGAGIALAGKKLRSLAKREIDPPDAN